MTPLRGAVVAAAPDAIGQRILRARSGGPYKWLKQNPRVYPVEIFGAVGDGVTDDTAAIQAAIDECSILGGVVQLGRWHRITAGLTVSANNVTIQGIGNYAVGSQLLIDSTSGIDAITISGQHSGVRDCYIRSARVYTNGFGVKLSGTFGGFVSNTRFDSVYNGIWVYQSTETWLTDIWQRSISGTYGIHAEASIRTMLRRTSCDNPYAGTPVAKAYTATTAYNVHDVVPVNGYLWECSAAGTSGSSTAWAVLPSTDATLARTTAVVDGAGTLRWKYISKWDCTWFDFNGGSTVSLSECAFINGVNGFVQEGGGFIGFMDRVEIDHPYSYGMDYRSGSGMHITNSWVSSVLDKSGVQLGAAYGGDFLLNNSYVFGCAEHGVLLASGHAKILGNNISKCGGKTANTYDGVHVNAGVSDFDVTGNTIGDIGAGSTSQRYAIAVDAGASDYYQLQPNRMRGNTTGEISDGGTGTNKTTFSAADSFARFFGDGSDGDLTISSGTTVVSSVKYYRNVTITGTAGIRNDGYDMYISGTLDLSGAPANSILIFPQTGGNASGATGGTATSPANAVLGAGGAGTNGATGGTGAGAQATAPTNSSPANGGAGGASGAGGTTGGNAGGASRSGATVANSVIRRTAPFPFTRGTSLILGGAGGAGGGSGGGDATNAGGGGGGGGGGGQYIVIYARYLKRGASTTAGCISNLGAGGGTGAAGVAGNASGGGGGGGGGGGYVVIIAGNLTGSQKSGAVVATGGAGGTGGNGLGTGAGAAGGTGGSGGNILIGELATGTWAATTGSAGAAGSAATGLTGGAGGSGGASSAAL